MIRVVGIGSPFGDDQAGWRVIELLRGHLPAAVDLVALDRPGATLINWMEGVDRLILVDAAEHRGAPGRVIEVGPATMPPAAHALSSHGLQLAETLRLAQALDCLPTRVEIYAIEMEDLERDGLSEPVATAASQLAQRLAARLRDGPGVTRGGIS